MVKVFNRITDIRNSRPPFPLLLIKCTLFPAMVYWDHLHLLLFSLRHGDKISPLHVWLKSSWQSGCVWWLWLRACCMHALASHGGDRKTHVRTTVFRTSLIFLFKARAKSFKPACLKLPQVLI